MRTKHHLVASSAALTLSVGATAAPQLDAQWFTEYDGPAPFAYDSSDFIGVAPDGNLVFAGRAGMSGWDGDIVVARYSPSGTLLSWDTWDSPTGGNDYVGAVAIAPDGSIAVAGYYYGGPAETSMFVAKWNAAGSFLWARTHNLNNGVGYHNTLAGVAVDGNGDIVACGQTGHFSANGDIAILKVEGSDGDLIWAKQYSSPGSAWDNAESIVVDSDGALLMCGRWGNPGADDDLGIWKCSPSDGSLIWARNHDVLPDSYDGFGGAALGPDDSITIVGWTWAGVGDQHVVVRYDTDGNEVFEVLPGAPADNRLFCVQVDADGNAYAGGEVEMPSFNDDFITMKIAPNGDVLWTRVFGDPVQGNDYALALMLRDDSVIVLGPSQRELVGGVAGDGKGPPTEEGVRVLVYDAVSGDLDSEDFVHPGDNHWMADATPMSGGRVAICGTSYPSDEEGQNYWIGVWAPEHDCDHNGVADSIDLVKGTLHDLDGDDVPDECAALGDLNGDGGIDGDDLGTLLGDWGECAGCPADLNGDGVVDGDDLGGLLGNWG